MLRLREPELDRPFSAGELGTAIALGVIPTILIVYAAFISQMNGWRTCRLCFWIRSGCRGSDFVWDFACAARIQRGGESLGHQAQNER